MKFTVKQFNDRFPTADACLEEIKQSRFNGWVCPKCEREDMLYKVAARPVYSCACGNQVHPLSGTIFHKSSTDLRTWFFAMYLMTQTRAGISAKQLERMTGVTYKTAWRMFTQIRKLMAENDGDLLFGTVEVDEAYIGGKDTKGRTGQSAAHAKGIVLGMVERGGRVRVKHVPSAHSENLMAPIHQNIAKGSRVVTDKHKSYTGLKYMGYQHDAINHTKGYITGDIHTNTIDGYWNQFKLGIMGVYRHVDKKYLQSYANEYAWRYSNRKSEIPMFELLLGRI